MGGGHCSEAISKLLPKKGWNYSVQDTREAFTTTELYPEAIERSHSTVEAFLTTKLQNRSHAFRTFFCSAMIIPKTLTDFRGCCNLQKVRTCHLMAKLPSDWSDWQPFKMEIVYRIVHRSWNQPSSLDRVRCPIGLNIGAESPEEIAIAVIAEILSMHKDADVHAPNWRDQ